LGLVILDRDGVINHDSDDYIKSPEEWEAIPGSLEAIARLNHAGQRILVVTNQSGIARKLFDVETLNRIHEKMLQQLGEVGGTIEAIFFCPHAPKDNCECRKPRPGLFQQVADRLRLPLDGVPAVGDSPRDLEAATAVGARPILVRTGKGQQTLDAEPEIEVAEIYDDLAAVADALIAELAAD